MALPHWPMYVGHYMCGRATTAMLALRPTKVNITKYFCFQLTFGFHDGTTINDLLHLFLGERSYLVQTLFSLLLLLVRWLRSILGSGGLAFFAYGRSLCHSNNIN